VPFCLIDGDDWHQEQDNGASVLIAIHIICVTRCDGSVLIEFQEMMKSHGT